MPITDIRNLFIRAYLKEKLLLSKLFTTKPPKRDVINNSILRCTLIMSNFAGQENQKSKIKKQNSICKMVNGKW